MNTGGKSPVFSPVGGESETAHILSLMGDGVVIQGRKSAETNTFQNRRKEVSNMAVFRIEKTRDYTVMSNHHLRDKSLSLKAKGLLSLMLSLPEEWDYQLSYLRKGKEHLNTSLNTLRPALTQYNQLAKGIRDKTKERRSLLSEKKALSAVHVFRHRELAAKIAALTEDLEELRSEKNLLLASLAYTEEDAAEQFPKDIAAMEQSLKRLEEQEQKYSVELDAALAEYAGLREQAQGFDPVQLYEARQAIRPSKEQEAENRAQEVYGEKYSPLLMFDSKKAVSRMLHEDIERQAVRRIVRQSQKEQQVSNKMQYKAQER